MKGGIWLCLGVLGVSGLAQAASDAVKQPALPSQSDTDKTTTSTPVSVSGALSNVDASIENIERRLSILQKESNTKRGDTTNFSTFETLNNSKSDVPVSLVDGNALPIGIEALTALPTLPSQTTDTPSSPTETLATKTAQTQIASQQGVQTPIDSQAQIPTSPVNLDPSQILPAYQTAPSEQVSAPPVNDTIEKKPNLIKRAYSRLFKDGANSTELLSTKIYLASPSDSKVSDPSAKPTKNTSTNDDVLVPLDDVSWQYESELLASRVEHSKTLVLKKADTDKQPYRNIKAALENIAVDSVGSFSIALPRLKEAVDTAARAVGYYDMDFYLRSAGNGTVDVVIYEIAEPVRVNTATFDIRGEGEQLEEFQALKKTNDALLDAPFHHGEYEALKAEVNQLQVQKGFFEGRWLDHSVDVILPDNTADASLVYDTGVQYSFDEVVFFTIDPATGELTTDPDKLPVRLPLLKKLVSFEPDEGFDQKKVNKLSSDLLATRYFNASNVEVILPSVSETQESDSDNSDGTASADTIIADSEFSATIAPIDFSASEDLLSKLNQVSAKAERLYNSPDDRVLGESKTKKSTSLLGRVSDTIGTLIKAVLPDESKDELPQLPEGVEPPTLAGKKTPEAVFQDKKVPLYVFVQSDKPHDAKIGLGWGSDTGARLTASLDDNLVNNGGYQAGISVAASKIDKGVNAYISRPLSHPLDDKLIGNLKYLEEEISQSVPNVSLSTRSLEAGVNRSILNTEGWNKTYGVRYRLDELKTQGDYDKDDLPVRFSEGRPTQEAVLAGITLSKFDQDNAAAPSRGFRQSYALEFGSKSLASSTDMAILKASLGGMYSFGDNLYGKARKHQLIGRVEGGYLWADDFFSVPYKLRFFAGGDQSLRGYDYQSISPMSEKGYLTGGQALAIASGEYSYEFREGLRGAIFADVGGAYDKDFSGDTKLGVGVGVRFASPVGTVRVDIAKGIEKDSTPIRLHFLIGLPF